MKRFQKSVLVAVLSLGCLLLPSFAPAQNPTEQDLPPGAGDASSPTMTAQSDSAQNDAAAPDSSAPVDQDPSQDPAGRVARLQYMTGSVSIQPGGVDDWVQGSINRPLTTSDNIWADKNSRAELGLGSSVLRIGSESSLTMTNIGDNVVQLQLHQGSLNVFVKKIFDGETYEVDTPNQAFTIRKAGDYRFDVDSTGDSTVVTVRRGEGEATGQGPAVRVGEGQQMTFTGTALAHTDQSAPNPDDFDQWCLARDKRVETRSASSRYVGPGMVGADDLDQYGSWKDDSTYGEVWYPNSVAAGWAPYRYGHWVWVSPWGWTWVDDAPWGFAPFHYGRWAYVGGYWGWLPGPYYARPIWAPALVGWYGGYGWGWGWGFGFGWGWGGVGFGWCALGWHEPFYPWYRGSRGYFRNVNITNTRITNINRVSNNYYNHTGNLTATNRVNMNHPGGFTAAPKSTLTNSSPVNKTMARVPASALHNAPSLNRPNVSPTRTSMLGANAGKPASSAPRSVESRPTVSRMTPPASSTRSSANQSASRGNAGNLGNRNAGSTPRAPENTASNRGASSVSRPSAGQTMPGHYVPRPPSAGGMQTSHSATQGTNRNESTRPTQTAMNHNTVPRPSAESTPRPAENSMSSRGSASNGGFNHNVPRPTGTVRSDPQQYSSHSYGGNEGYGSRSYDARGYGDYDRYSGRSYGGGYSGRSYGGGSYGGGSHGSYGGGGYHGSSGGHSSGGGGHSGGGHR